MITCKLCAWYYSEIDKEGIPITKEFCHYNRFDGQSPCELEDIERETEDY